MLQGVQCVALVRQTSLYIFPLLCMNMEILCLCHLIIRLSNRKKVFWCYIFYLLNYGDSSSLTNEKDHHYFLNSADVCW